MTPEVLCGLPAVFRWQWVNGQVGLACIGHAEHMQGVARAMGCVVHLEPVEDGTCSQKISAATVAKRALDAGEKP